MNKQTCNLKASRHVGTVAITVLAIYALSVSNNPSLSPTTVISAAPKPDVKLTPTLAAWISSQSGYVIEEMVAIAKDQVDTKQFSIVYYLRYLNLCDSLRVVASKAEKVDEFKWINKKVKSFSRIYDSIVNILMAYLRGVNSQMYDLEELEVKTGQNPVLSGWVSLYDIIKYISIFAPKGSELAKRAEESLLTTAVLNVPDTKRSTRYKLHLQAFS